MAVRLPRKSLRNGSQWQSMTVNDSAKWQTDSLRAGRTRGGAAKAAMRRLCAEQPECLAEPPLQTRRRAQQQQQLRVVQHEQHARDLRGQT
jgi:hypothetical protein